jgi:tripartite-type tricarboxylate transporter receptor subunit TctC
VLVVSPSLPVRTVAELISYAKANRGKVNMASFGTGSSSHVAGELFKSMTGTDLAHVPYRGEAPALTDLIGGQVQMMFVTMPSSLPHVQAGTLRALGMAGRQRVEQLPDVLTVGDTVLGYEANSWGGIAAPRGTPAEIIERLNREFNAGLENPRVKARLSEVGTIPLLFKPSEFGAYLESEITKWAKVVRAANIKPE